MKKDNSEYVEIDAGAILKVYSREFDLPIHVGQKVIVIWNETTLLSRRVKRISNKNEYDKYWSKI